VKQIDKMADEARAMLDALMGSDRNDVPPTSNSSISQDQWNRSRKGNKKSCYDTDICPLYCAWGTDVFDLFTNTKSDLGPNPYIVQEDAREEFKSLPEHEKERLGYEHMLYRKLGDLVRGCDRIVARNKDKLRAEMAKTARSRGAGSNSVDPVTSVKEEMLKDAADNMADVELKQEELEELVEKVIQIESEEKNLYEQMKKIQMNDVPSVDGNNNENSDVKKCKDEDKKSINENEEENNIIDETLENKKLKDEGETSEVRQETKHEVTVKNEKVQAKDEPFGQIGIIMENESEGQNLEQDNVVKTEDKDLDSFQLDKIAEIKTKLHGLCTKKQKHLSSIIIITSTIVSLRDNIKNLQKQLYYVRNDTTSDKTVCETSGNFMSSRDADERIAAHYAGKQYVGWKMVRDKFKELIKKYSSGRGPNSMRPNGGFAPTQQQQWGQFHGGPPGQGPGYGSYNGGNGGPSNGWDREHNRVRNSGYNDSERNKERKERSRSREKEYSSSRSSRGDSGRSRGRKRRSSPSPARWERDRGPHSSSGGREGSHSRSHRDDRTWGR